MITSCYSEFQMFSLTGLSLHWYQFLVPLKGWRKLNAQNRIKIEGYNNMNHQKSMSDFGAGIVPTLNLSQIRSNDNSFSQNSFKAKNEPQRRQYFTTHGQLDQKIAKIESLISSLQSNIEEKRGHRRVFSNHRLSKKDLIFERAMIGYILPIKNLKKWSTLLLPCS